MISLLFSSQATWIYPHFRSDGWIYFLVRDELNGVEYVVASDAALRAN
ncbi:MAG: hypothetical protein AB7P03_28485 [Kofleriaceae bacterium]